MEQFSVEPWVSALQLGVFLASVAMWLQIAAWWRSGDAILNYEPRQPVPWGPVAILPAAAFVLMALLPGPPNDVHPPRELADEPLHAGRLVAAIFLQAMMTALVIGIALLSRAKLRDLGVVRTARQVFRDVGLGLAALLAIVAPVHGVQALLLSLTGQKEVSNHPLVKMVSGDEPQWGVFALATIAAVVVAPICEEILYRLVLQGWLEKWEKTRMGRQAQPSTNQIVVNGSEIDARNAQPDMEPATEDASNLDAHVNPTTIGLIGLPQGWFPILISSALFATAHYGYGPEPVPIFLLALILGYVYQRTHRIIPCIVAHALFNGLTMVALWGMTRNS